MPLVPHRPETEAEAHAAVIVALDAGDLAGSDRARAEALAAACDGCAALLEDLGAIRGAMGALPAPVRRRDYRLTEEDVARLRPSAWRRALGWLAAPGSSVRPLATGLATLGVVGLLLTAGIPGLGGFGAGVAGVLSTVGSSVGGAEAAGSPDRDAALPAEPAAAPSMPAAASSRAPAPLPTAAPAEGPDQASPGYVAGVGASPAPIGERNGSTTAPGQRVGAAAGDLAAATDTGTAVPVGVVASLALLLAGLGLLLAAALARRRAR